MKRRISRESMVILATERWPGFEHGSIEQTKRYKRALDELVAAHDSLLAEVEGLEDRIRDLQADREER